MKKKPKRRAKVADDSAGTELQYYKTTVFHTYISYNDLKHYKTYLVSKSFQINRRTNGGRKFDRVYLKRF